MKVRPLWLQFVNVKDFLGRVHTMHFFAVVKGFHVFVFY
jgi:hypothetical protein